MTPGTLLDWLAGHLDGGYGPDDGGYVEATYSPSTGVLEVAYTDDETGEETRFNLKVVK